MKKIMLLIAALVLAVLLIVLWPGAVSQQPPETVTPPAGETAQQPEAEQTPSGEDQPQAEPPADGGATDQPPADIPVAEGGQQAAEPEQTVSEASVSELMKKLTADDIATLKAMLADGITEEEKSQAWGIAYARYNEAEIARIKELYQAYVGK